MLVFPVLMFSVGLAGFIGIQLAGPAYLVRANRRPPFFSSSKMMAVLFAFGVAAMVWLLASVVVGTRHFSPWVLMSIGPILLIEWLQARRMALAETGGGLIHLARGVLVIGVMVVNVLVAPF
ncbi:MAG: hypothetical protein J0H02_10975 [Armatimonadetes bacterium]|nr:hypothetical protein [Armatimonadota bacterium]